MGLTVCLGLGQEVNSRQTITDDDMCHERNSVPRQRRDEGSIRAQAVFSEEMAFQLRLDGSAIRELWEAHPRQWTANSDPEAGKSGTSP